ncbi:MAG: hypothetical protein CMM46_09050 [Rhodospirillaceae bacterium]|nr:hypothetical protein [Rhodospirillaceae bacterium]
MIPSGQEISSSLQGAWQLIFLDPNAMDHFTVTIDGFWRSFFAAVVALPYFLVAIIWPAPAPEGAPLWEPNAVLATLGYILSWIIFPIVAAFVARQFELTQRYIGYIIAFNWSGALVAQPLLVMEFMGHAGLIGANTLGALHMPIFVFVLFYGWAIARIALGASTWLAAGLIFIAKMIDMVIVALMMQP